MPAFELRLTAIASWPTPSRNVVSSGTVERDALVVVHTERGRDELTSLAPSTQGPVDVCRTFVQPDPPHSSTRDAAEKGRSNMTSESACARTSALSDSALASLTSCWSSHPRIGRPRACTRGSSGARSSACRRGAAKAGARPHFATTCVRPFWSGRNRARSPRSTTIRRRARPQASIEERASVEVQSVAGRSECDQCGQVSILRPTGSPLGRHSLLGAPAHASPTRPSAGA